jgi:glyoxylase-like metal-dependent hydrolase (beta-lactamase superfamily II)
LLIRDARALLIADGIIRYGPPPVRPRRLLGDDPEGVKAGLREAYSRLLDRDFDNLLFAHGDPVIGDGKTALRRFAEI